MVARDTRPRSGGGTRVATRAGAETLALGVSGEGLKAGREPSPSRVDPGTMAVPEPPSARSTYTTMNGKPTVAVAPVSTHAPIDALDALRVDAAPVDFDALRDGDARGDVGTVGTSTRVEPRGADDARAFPDAFFSKSSSPRRRCAGTSSDVPHVRQTHDWDCGLACALMVLKALVRRADADPNTSAHARLPRSHGARRADLPTLRRRCPTQSVWTIDLAHLLRSFHPLCDVAFYTVTLGANPAFCQERFYRDSIKNDEARVARLFAGAAAAGIFVQKRSVCLRNVKRWAASAEWILIVLVDKRALAFAPEREREEREACERERAGAEGPGSSHETRGGRLKKTKTDDFPRRGEAERVSRAISSTAILDRVFGAPRSDASAAKRASFARASAIVTETEPGTETPFAPRNDASKERPPFDGYTGHYVVVCGYDAATDCFCVRDPSGDDEGSVVPARSLETARRAFGTDEDLLLVRRRRER